MNEELVMLYLHLSTVNNLMLSLFFEQIFSQDFIPSNVASIC